MTADEQHEPDAIAPITEKQLARLWQRRAVRHRAFRSETGARVQVLYPGRPGVTAGPDFRNALLVVENQGLVQGDVEVHLRQKDWRSHGHHNDPNYNGVILHVALESEPEPSRTDSGGTPVTVNLTDLLSNDQDDDLDGEAGTRPALAFPGSPRVPPARTIRTDGKVAQPCRRRTVFVPQHTVQNACNRAIF